MVALIYEPREDSFLLASVFSEYVTAGMKVLDVGCGSGYLLEKLRECGAVVVGVDVNPDAVAQCRSLGFVVVESDLFEHVSERFDVVVCNSPYLPVDPEEDVESRLSTTGGLEFVERFMSGVRDVLVPSGKALLVVSSLTGDVQSVFEKFNFDFKIVKQESYFFEKLLVYELTPKAL